MNPDELPFGAAIGDDGVWRQVLTRLPGTDPRPALFLDRDGVIVEEVHYLHKVEEMQVVAGAADVIRHANSLSVPVVVVTNQAGIGRGKYGWKEFIAVQDAMLDELASEGAFVNAVFACPHHSNGVAPYNVDNHPARKPNPGMLLAAAELLPIMFDGSWIVGDRAGDIEAAKRAGCDGGVHVFCGHGSEPGERDAAMSQRTGGFEVKTAETIADAAGLIPLLDKSTGD